VSNAQSEPSIGTGRTAEVGLISGVHATPLPIAPPALYITATLFFKILSGFPLSTGFLFPLQTVSWTRSSLPWR
jgi:hypothetical protein